MVTSFASWPRSIDASSDAGDNDSVIMDKQQQKKPRHRHSAVQLAALNELYDKNEHPSLEDRTSLAKRLGMEVKTVNAWFQNKRASTKKRQQQQLQNKAQRSNNPYELPPISALLASAPSPSTSSPVSRPVHRSSLPVEYDDYFDEEDHIMHSHLPPIGGYPPHQSAFYAGTAEGRHIIESTPEPTVPRKMRFRPTPQQTEELRKVYNVNPHPSKEEREELGESIGMRYQSVTNWFQNQRSLAKKRKEDEADGLNSDAHSVAESRRTRTSSPVTYSAFPPASSHPSLGLGVPSASALHPSLRPSTPSVPRSMPYSVSGSSRARPRRSRPEPYQLEKLKDLFRRTSTPSIEERGALALEIDMELSKVTNWFRNLRQTARRRGMRVEDFLDEYDGGSAEVSRAGTPAPSGVSSAASLPDDADRMEMDVEDADSGLNMRLTSRSHSDASDEEYQEEIVTPSPSPPPSASAPVKVHTTSPISDWAEKTCMERCAMHGVKMEDALLLLSFHQSAVLGA